MLEFDTSNSPMNKTIHLDSIAPKHLLRRDAKKFSTPVSYEMRYPPIWISCHKVLKPCLVRHKNEILGIAFLFSMFTGYSKMPSSVATYLTYS